MTGSVPLYPHSGIIWPQWSRLFSGRLFGKVMHMGDKHRFPQISIFLRSTLPCPSQLTSLFPSSVLLSVPSLVLHSPLSSLFFHALLGCGWGKEGTECFLTAAALRTSLYVPPASFLQGCYLVSLASLNLFWCPAKSSNFFSSTKIQSRQFQQHWVLGNLLFSHLYLWILFFDSRILKVKK